MGLGSTNYGPIAKLLRIIQELTKVYTYLTINLQLNYLHFSPVENI
jgi:hypothetical protein